MIRTGMRGIIELIRKHPKIRRILRCESPYFHHWSSSVFAFAVMRCRSVTLVSCVKTNIIIIIIINLFATTQNIHNNHRVYMMAGRQKN